MKKEKVSVLKRPNEKNTGNKVNKVAKNKPSKVEKNKVTTVSPRGAKKSSITDIKDASVGNNLKTLKKIPSKSADKENSTSIPVVKVKKEKKAVTPKNDENETRGQTKMAAKNNDANVSSVASSKPGKKLKSKIESDDTTKKVKAKNLVNTEKSKKTKIEPVDEIEIVTPEVANATSKNSITKAKRMAVKDSGDVTLPKQKSKKAKIESVDEIKNGMPEVKKVTSKNSITNAEKRMAIENSGDLKLTKQRVLESVKAILKLAKKKLDSKKSLLGTENQPILLQVVCVKIARTPRRQIRPLLPHSIIGPLDDVAIIVPDLEKGRRKDYEKTVDHWETIFREKGVEGITEIIPMNRVKTEYDQFEMKRKLAMSFDYFLADGRICGHLTHLLGRDFFKRRYPPTPVKLGAEDLKTEVKNGLHKTCLEVHSYGNSHTVQIGSVSMEPAKLAENIWATCEALAVHYPGGWENIRAIRIQTQNCPAVPIYLTLESKNKIAIPVVKPKRPRAYETVEGELTTLPGSATVTMTPEGQVKFRKAQVSEDADVKSEMKEEDDDDDNDDDGDDDDDDDDDDEKKED